MEDFLRLFPDLVFGFFNEAKQKAQTLCFTSLHVSVSPESALALRTGSVTQGEARCALLSVC